MDETMNKLSQWEKEVGEYEALEWERIDVYKRQIYG